MQVTVVYESLFGNTHEIAEAIARGIANTRADARVDVVAVADAQPAQAAVADLLVVGGPTHMHGMSSGLSRHLTVAGQERTDPAERHEIEPGAEGPGLRDWLGRLPEAGTGCQAAAFDTRLASRWAGGAAKGIAHRLQHHRYELVAGPQGFLIQDDAAGPLQDGELDRAHAWGVELAGRVARLATS